MLKMWVVIRVFILMARKQKIDAMRLVRSTLILNNPHTSWEGSKRNMLLAKDFVEDVEVLVWPTHY